MKDERNDKLLALLGRDDLRRLAQDDDKGQHVALFEDDGLATDHALTVQEGAVQAVVARAHRFAFHC